jgi:hypothetical protein
MHVLGPNDLLTVAMKYLSIPEDAVKAEPVPITNLPPNYGFLATDETSIRTKEIQVNIIQEILACIRSGKLTRSSMQSTIVMLVDVFPENFAEYMPEGLQDAVEGYTQWLKEDLKGKQPTTEDLKNLVENKTSREKWLKSRRVSIVDWKPEEEVINPEGGKKGMFLYYLGESS